MYCNLWDECRWFNAYNMGFGANKLLCPGFEFFSYTYMASFFQTVAPLYLSRLGEDLYSDWSHTRSQLGSSQVSVINQEHLSMSIEEENLLDQNNNHVLPEAAEFSN
jgi:hypothetical protein